MAGQVFAFQAAVKCWLAAGCLALLAGCVTPPEPPVPADTALVLSPTASTASTPATPSLAPVAETPRPSRLTDFIARRFRRQIESAVPAVEAETPGMPDMPVDEKYQFTGEDARELERGHASWYGARFHGRRTASGENYDKYALTAAHKTLPFGTIVRVRSLALGREVDVRINDRGPFSPGRVIDVSQAAAEALGLVGAGIAEVSLNVANSPGDTTPSRSRKKSAPRRAARKPADPYRH
ncbi:Rare lipoprotein A precursor [Polaromonas sp. CG9_12]|nr:Rare lipoprotein A precursor [Polaromonas sp. CG9_12]